MLTVQLDVNGHVIAVLDIHNIGQADVPGDVWHYEASLYGSTGRRDVQEIGTHDRYLGAWPLVAQAIERLGLNPTMEEE